MSAAQSAETRAELASLEEEVELPYTVENVTLMSPGTWNNIKWTQQEIENAFQSTQFDEDHNRALFLDHEDQDSEQWIGQVKNIRMQGEDMVGDLEIVDKDTAVKLEWGAKFGVSPKVTGKSDGEVMRDFEFDNFSIVVNPAVKTTFINSELIQTVENSETEELQETSIHEPEFDGTEDTEWEKPTLNELAGESSWDDLGREERTDVDDHFIVSKSGFPPENFGDLALPVVSEDGNLNLNALQNAKARAGQVEGVDASDEEEINNIINRLANENFPDANFGEDEETEDMAESLDIDEEVIEELGTHTNFNERQFAEFVASIYNERTGEVMEALPNAEPDFDERQLAGWLAALYNVKTGTVMKGLNAIATDRIILENDTMSEDTMSDEQEENVGDESEVDVEDLAQKVAEILQDEEEAEEEEADEEPEEVEEENAEEVEAETEEEPGEVEAEEFDDFSEFASVKKEQNPEASYTQIAEEFEEAHKDPVEKAKEAAKEEMSEEVDELKNQISELKDELESEEEEAEPQRASATLSEEERKDVEEEIRELDDEELDEAMFAQWLTEAGQGNMVRG